MIHAERECLTLCIQEVLYNYPLLVVIERGEIYTVVYTEYPAVLTVA